jgi:tetratricopeptide (TPR) repeat protein
MPVLTGEQFDQLQHLLTEDFDKPAIEELVRKRLGRRLDTILNPAQSTPRIVFELLTWVDQRGPSTLEVVLQGVLAQRPEDGALRAFCEQVVPGALRPSDTQPSVKGLTSSAPQPFIGVPPRIASFTGRAEELDRLDEILMRDKPAAVTQPSVGRVAVQGMGGVGKTALAMEYAHRFRGLYAGVCWCPAETHTGLLSALARLAVTLGAAAAEEADVENAARAALRRLAEQRATWLLVYDNVPAPDAIADLLPSAGARVLITSRFSDWSELANDLALDVLSPEEAVALLQERTRRSDTAGAQTLAEALGHLPLALDHAGAYCKRAGVQFADYTKKASRLINVAPRGIGYPRSVAATFDLAITQAVTQCPAAETLMAYLAQCGPERIPMRLVEGAVEDDAERQEAIAALAEVSLIKHDLFEDGTSAITVHRLVQAVARARSEATSSAQHAVTGLIGRLAAIYPKEGYSDPRSWPLCAQLTPHLLALRHAYPKAASGVAGWAELLGLAGRYFLRRAAYSQSEPLLRDALAIREKVLGPEHPDTANTLGYLARLLRDQGNLAEARPLFERALAICEKVLGPEHPDTAVSLTQLALLLDRQGNLGEARPLFERALAICEKAICEKVLGPDDLEKVLGPDDLLAALLRNQGNLAEARPLFERALAIYEKVFGPEHPDTAVSLTHLALLLDRQGNLRKARPLFERALAICEKVLGPDHPNTGTSLNNLAALLRDQGNLAEARPLFERALAIYEKALGPEHPDTAATMSNLARVLRDSGQTHEAEPLFHKAIAIGEKALGCDRSETHRYASHYARLLIETGRAAEALSLAKRALATHEATSGLNHPWTKDSARVTADALDALGRTEKAKALRAKYGITPETPSAS